jgi:hypothetical protein
MLQPSPLEIEQPGLVAILDQISRKEHPTIKWINIDPLGSIVFFKDGKHKVIMRIERNDPCYCGSGNKFKRCCINIRSDRSPLICHHCHKPILAQKDKADLTTCRCFDPK